MTTGPKARRSLVGLALAASVGAVALIAFSPVEVGAASSAGRERALVGEARRGSVTVQLAPAVEDVAVSGRAGRPVIVIDPGHGGRDPGATAVSGTVSEKQLTLALAKELRDLLVERGRVRVALTREDDRSLSLEQRASIARRLGASMFLSLHMDAAPNPLARGASVYSLSDVASDADAARFARAENRSNDSVVSEVDGRAQAILSDLALREQMIVSAGLAERVIRKASGRVLMRPEPHRHAAFHVLRRAEVPAVLFEAGYISNADDELMLRSAEHRHKLVLALAQAIEADVAARSRR
ncbi:MAG TPA: N-acetylmuramoyl-L-alanine amidase [Sphingomicrobium sp.]|nr:N-acetylmuramoyl-L-alanine amidase [Sphingomicrobium sp.]